MCVDSIASVVCAIQGAREILERHCSEEYASDVMLVAYVLGAVEGDLLAMWEDSNRGPEGGPPA